MEIKLRMHYLYLKPTNDLNLEAFLKLGYFHWIFIIFNAPFVNNSNPSGEHLLNFMRKMQTHVRTVLKTCYNFCSLDF